VTRTGRVPVCEGIVKRLTSARLLWRSIALLTLSLFLLGLSGCNTSTPAIGVTLTPSSTPGIDQAQTLAITASVAHDSKGAGVKWSVSGGGSFSGTPTTTSATYQAPASVTAAFTATVTATSISDSSKSATLQIRVSPLPAVTTSSLPAATAGSNYNQPSWLSPAERARTHGASPRRLPPGIILDPDLGSNRRRRRPVAGTPCGSYTFTVTDAAGNSATTPSRFAITVGPPASPLTITTHDLARMRRLARPTAPQWPPRGGVPSLHLEPQRQSILALDQRLDRSALGHADRNLRQHGQFHRDRDRLADADAQPPNRSGLSPSWSYIRTFAPSLRRLSHPAPKARPITPR
jgi:hypothetical protein